MNWSLLVLWISIAVCLLLSCISMKKAGVKTDGLIAFVPLSLFFGFFLAHFCYCLTRFTYSMYDMYRDMFPGYGFLTFWDGRYMLYGGAVGVIIALLISCRIGDGKPLQVMDAVSPWAALMIAGVRLSMGLDGQFYGDELYDLEETFLQGFPCSMFDDYYEVWHWALYLPAIAVAIGLMDLLLHNTRKAPGDKALLLGGLYGCSQIILETLRRDAVLRWGFVRCSQVISALLALFVLLCYFFRAKGHHTVKRILALVFFFLAAGVCFLMEFAAEQRIRWLLFLSTEGAYLVSALGCWVMARCILLMREAEPDIDLQKA